MTSVKSLIKNQISKNQNGYDYSVTNKSFWYNFYIDYFIKLITNYWEWVNLPPSIDEIFLEKNLCLKGFLGMFMDDRYGLVVSRGAMGSTLDIYDNPLEFIPVNNGQAVRFNRVGINWYTDNLDPKKAIIISNNNFNSPSTEWLMGFCEKLADIEQTIQLNRNAQIKPYVLICDDKTKFSMKNIFNKILNGDPVLYLNEAKGTNGALQSVQLQDRVSVLDLKTEYLLDKLHDEKNRVINQILTIIGINNTSIDKAERLVVAEATSNNGLINASIEVNYKSRRECVMRINKCWNIQPPIEVRPSSQIQPYNTEKVLNDLGSGVIDPIEGDEE